MSTKLPQTDSIQELAQFWDTHDVTDFEEELEEVNEPVFEGATTVRVHLPPDAAEALRETAHSQGLDAAELIRQWVLEKVRLS